MQDKSENWILCEIHTVWYVSVCFLSGDAVYWTSYAILNRWRLTIFFKLTQLGAHCFLVYLFLLLYMFRAICAYHQESLLHLCDTGIFQTRQPPIQTLKYQCRIDTVSSPDDRHIVARNTWKSWNKYTKKQCAPSWVHLKKFIQGCTVNKILKKKTGIFINFA